MTSQLVLFAQTVPAPCQERCDTLNCDAACSHPAQPPHVHECAPCRMRDETFQGQGFLPSECSKQHDGHVFTGGVCAYCGIKACPHGYADPLCCDVCMARGIWEGVQPVAPGAIAKAMQEEEESEPAMCPHHNLQPCTCKPRRGDTATIPHAVHVHDGVDLVNDDSPEDDGPPHPSYPAYVPTTAEGIPSPVVPNNPHAGKIEREFWHFHTANPQVYEILVRLANEAKAKGRSRGGIGMFWEVMRWEIWLGQTANTTEFKLNNNYRSRYARLIMQLAPGLKDFFQIRNLRS